MVKSVVMASTDTFTSILESCRLAEEIEPTTGESGNRVRPSLYMGCGERNKYQ